MTIAPPFLSLDQITKSYGGKSALNGVSFTVQAGEVVGLLGPNGAGKSTVFQICASLFAPDSGNVAIFGLDYRTVPSLILARVGVVFQSRSLDADISVRHRGQNARSPRAPRRQGPRRFRQ